MIDLSIVPSFRCNLNCIFCYLGKLKNDMSLLRVEKLRKVINENDIRDIDIYGGEISLLDTEYVDQLMEVISGKKTSLVSNAIRFQDSAWKKYYCLDNVSVSFSYDIARNNLDDIKDSILKFDEIGKEYSIICVDVCDLDYQFLSGLKNMKNLSLKPYSKSTYNQIDFKQHMLDIIQTLHDKYADLFNKLEKVTSYRDKIQHFFLLPDGKLYDIQYDGGMEYFCSIDDCKSKICMQCLSCKYYRKCFNEHYNGYEATKDCIGRQKVMEYIDGLHNIC